MLLLDIAMQGVKSMIADMSYKFMYKNSWEREMMMMD
jgi:hypothetical protein